MKSILFSAFFILSSAAALAGAADTENNCCPADTLQVVSWQYSGPVALQRPFIIDTVNVNGDSCRFSAALKGPHNFDALWKSSFVDAIAHSEGPALHYVGFCVDNESFVKAALNVSGCGDHKLYVDGEESDGSELSLDPGTHRLALVICSDKSPDSLDISLCAPKDRLKLRGDGKKRYSLSVNSDGLSCGGVSVSAGGKYAALTYRLVSKGGERSSYTEIRGLKDGRVYWRGEEAFDWMPNGDECCFERKNAEGGIDLLCADPSSGVERVLATNIPDGNYTISPAGDCLIYSIQENGPQEGEVHQILSPEDRQPGWRQRSHLARYDLATGTMQPLTFGYHNAYLTDISADGGHILFMSSRERLTKRPTTLFSIYKMDLHTLETECVVKEDGFVADARFSPDASEILVYGSPEAFDAFAAEVKPGQIPSQYQYQLFVVKDGKVRTLTKGFTVSVQKFDWSRTDGKIYFTAEDKDCVSLFRLDPGKEGSLENLGSKVENIYSFSLASAAASLVYYGQGLEYGHRAYVLDTRKLKQALVADFAEGRLSDVTLGKGHAYEFTSSRGDRINGFYVLPPDFDPSKKYPLIVHYYGGCSPSSRYCIGSYSPQWYAAQGYVFYVINPSGASGFGQEFAARHVNTAGEGVAEDIIEGTQRFCEEHSYVDKSHIGCFSASYGGFMTQLLLTKTDIYATGISHAGISDHTSYWGEGWWGYSYSEVCMADSYPWTRKDLYVDRSPLYNADKIHTPLLFLHGSADTNVPIGESIQMYTALRLLGRETAFVVVDGENHGIFDYSKKALWLKTISAWFAKYLKEDSSWWDELYPPKNL